MTALAALAGGARQMVCNNGEPCFCPNVRTAKEGRAGRVRALACTSGVLAEHREGATRRPRRISSGADVARWAPLDRGVGVDALVSAIFELLDRDAHEVARLAAVDAIAAASH